MKIHLSGNQIKFDNQQKELPHLGFFVDLNDELGSMISNEFMNEYKNYEYIFLCNENGEFRIEQNFPNDHVHTTTFISKIDLEIGFELETILTLPSFRKK